MFLYAKCKQFQVILYTKTHWYYTEKCVNIEKKTLMYSTDGNISYCDASHPYWHCCIVKYKILSVFIGIINILMNLHMYIQASNFHPYLSTLSPGRKYRSDIARCSTLPIYVAFGLLSFFLGGVSYGGQ